jgi:hypothetical protein
MARNIGGGCILVGLLVHVITGCNDSNSNRAEVTGLVNFDGQPISEGSIVFSPAGGNSGPVAGASIHDGSYLIPAKTGVTLGLNRVEIYASRKTGRKVRSPPPAKDLVDEIVEAIPARYNKKSELEKYVHPGKNVFDFELKSNATK